MRPLPRVPRRRAAGGAATVRDEGVRGDLPDPVGRAPVDRGVAHHERGTGGRRLPAALVAGGVFGRRPAAAAAEASRGRRVPPCPGLPRPAEPDLPGGGVAGVRPGAPAALTRVHRGDGAVSGAGLPLRQGADDRRLPPDEHRRDPHRRPSHDAAAGPGRPLSTVEFERRSPSCTTPSWPTSCGTSPTRRCSSTNSAGMPIPPASPGCSGAACATSTPSPTTSWVATSPTARSRAAPSARPAGPGPPLPPPPADPPPALYQISSAPGR